jgi:hypothetical protein
MYEARLRSRGAMPGTSGKIVDIQGEKATFDKPGRAAQENHRRVWHNGHAGAIIPFTATLSNSLSLRLLYIHGVALPYTPQNSLIERQ